MDDDGVREVGMSGECVIDCDGCAVRGDACGDCVVSFMLGGPPGELDEHEVQALDLLAKGGLVPPLQMRPLRPAVGED